MAQAPGEIITLQLGGFANYVGAHYWNLQDELLGYASLPPGDGPCSSSLASAMAAATVDPTALFELREPNRGGGGGGGATTTAAGRGLYAVPRVVCLDTCGATGGVSFSADAAGRLGGGGGGGGGLDGGGGGGGGSAGAGASSSSSLHRAPPIPKSAFVRALEAQEILMRQLRLRNAAGGAGAGGGGGLFPSDPAAAARLEEQQQRQLEAAARALDEAAAEAGVDLPSAASSGGAKNRSNDDDSRAVRYWTDYLKVQLHPRSAVLVPGLWHGVQSLDGYGAGGGASLGSAAGGGGGTGGGCGGALSGGAGAEAREAAVDALRAWGEACDRLQGLQVFADDMTGFGALGAAVLREAADDLFPRRPLLYFSLRGPDRPGSVVAVSRAAAARAAAAAGAGGGAGAQEDLDDDNDDEADEFGLGKGTGRGAGGRIGGGGGVGGAGGSASGGAGGNARQRQLLSEALSAAEAACPEDGFASLYVPLSAPAPGSAEARALPWLRGLGGGGGGGGLSAAGAAYRAAALLAAAADTATLPSRVPAGASAAPPLGPAVGAGIPLADLCRGLQARPSGGPRAPMAALGVALPCGAVEEEEQEGGLAAAAGGGGGDPRERPGGGPSSSSSSAFLSSSLYKAMALPTVASLTPGVHIGCGAGADGHSGRLLSESVVLRGARCARSGGPSPLAAAAAALDAALLAERRRIGAGAGTGGGGGAVDAWMQQRCVVAPPLAVPLPFPGLFSGRVTRDGCVVAAASSAAKGGGGHHVASAPVLSRLAASSAFSARLDAMAVALRPSSGGCGALAAAWGYDGAELEELGERLTRMGGGGGGE